MIPRLSPKIIKDFKSVAGSGNWTDNPDILASHLTEWRGKYHGKTPLMVMPRCTQDVSNLAKLAAQHRISLVPQGGNTGLVGGGLPGLDDQIDQILMSFKHMTKVTHEKSDSLIAEAGVTITSLQQAAEGQGRYFPLSLASEESCTVGGTIATNAGGIHVIRYGTMRSLTLGVEAVLPGGGIINELRPVLKDNTGYRLTPLLAGSEGTLGLITKARLKLFPPEDTHLTLWADLLDMSSCLSLLEMCQRIGGTNLSVFEVMSREALILAEKNIEGCAALLKTRDRAAPWSALIEFGFSGQSETRKDEIARKLCLLTEPSGSGIVHLIAATNNRHRSVFFHCREHLSEAQKREGISVKHDISLPLETIDHFIQTTTAKAQKMIEGVRPIIFGHLGDGNLHFNLMQPVQMDGALFAQNWDRLQNMVHEQVSLLGGSISAEHGIGRMKKKALARYEDPDKITAMKKIKSALDPDGLFNPGVIFDV